MGEWSYQTPQEILAKYTRKRPKEPTMMIDEKKKTGPKGKAGKRPTGWVRPLYVHNKNNHLVCVAALHLWLLLLEKRGNTLHA